MMALTAPLGSFADHILPDVEPFPGAVVIASIRAPKLAARDGDPTRAMGKARPAVVKDYHRKLDKWVLWGITTLERFDNGKRRHRAVGLTSAGLPPSYCWGGGPALVPPSDVIGVIWAAPYELLLACAEAEAGWQKAGPPEDIAAKLYAPLVEAGWYWPKWSDE